MSKRKVLLCMGLQRSGNHAVLGWVESLFPAVTFHNDQPHDLCADGDGLRALLEADDAPLTILSFEDSQNRARQSGLLLRQSLAPPPDWLAEDYDLHRMVILRDPYNTWASRVAANARAAEFGRPLTSDPSWELYRENWLDLASLAGDPDYATVLFTQWKDDADYRRALCARLGGTYSEESLDTVPRQGGGSSFDGVPRPELSQMMGNWRKYTSAAFLKRLASKPGHYVSRLLSPPKTGRNLKVDERWTTLQDDAESAPLFADPKLYETAAGIFGVKILPPRTMLKF